MGRTSATVRDVGVSNLTAHTTAVLVSTAFTEWITTVHGEWERENISGH